MIKDPFLKAMMETLEDEVDRIDFEQISPEYAAKIHQINSILETLESLPETVETQTGPVEVRALIKKLDETWTVLSEICFDIGLKRGFSLAYKFIFFSLTMDSGACLSDKETTGGAMNRQLKG